MSGNGGKVELTTQDLSGGMGPKSCFLFIYEFLLLFQLKRHKVSLYLLLKSDVISHFWIQTYLVPKLKQRLCHP